MAFCAAPEMYKGRGQVWLAVRNANGTLGEWEPIAEARSLEIATTQEFESVYSRCDRNSGLIGELLNQTDYEITIETIDMSLATIAKAVYGAFSSVISASVVDEPAVFAGVGATISVAHPFGLSAVSVKQGATTVDPTDYQVDLETGAIRLIDASGLTGPAPYNLTVSYTHGAYEKVEAAITGVTNYALRFDGVGVFDNRPVQVYMHNIAMRMSSTLGFITDEVGTLTLTGKLLADSTKGVGKSAYFTVAKGAAAV